MNFSPVKPDVVKYEMRMVQGMEPAAVHKKKAGGFGRFLSSIGSIFGAIAAPLSIIFPPAMIGSLGAYGLAKIGDSIQNKAMTKQMNQEAIQNPSMSASFPGLADIGEGGQVSPGLSSVQADILNVLYSKNDLMMESSHAMEK